MFSFLYEFYSTLLFSFSVQFQFKSWTSKNNWIEHLSKNYKRQSILNMPNTHRIHNRKLLQNRSVNIYKCLPLCLGFSVELVSKIHFILFLQLFLTNHDLHNLLSFTYKMQVAQAQVRTAYFWCRNMYHIHTILYLSLLPMYIYIFRHMI